MNRFDNHVASTLEYPDANIDEIFEHDMKMRFANREM